MIDKQDLLARSVDDNTEELTEVKTLIRMGKKQEEFHGEMLMQMRKEQQLHAELLVQMGKQQDAIEKLCKNSDQMKERSVASTVG